MQRLSILLASVATMLLMVSGSASAGPLLLTFDCTISGTGSGTNNCAEGATVAQVLIEETGTAGVLSVSAKTPLSGSHQLHALFLNYGGPLDSNGLFSDLLVEAHPPAGPQNDVNTIQFSFDGSFTDTNIIEVKNGGTTALNYKGFDLMLCDNGVGQCDFDLSTDFAVLGYLRSGNSFNLTPELFDAFTADSGNANNPDELLLATNPCTGFVPGHLRAAVHITSATSGTLDAACLQGGSYGPYYGDGEEIDVPEPRTVAILLLGLAGLGFRQVAARRAIRT